MAGQSEVNELCGVYEEMDDAGREKMFQIFKKFLDIQKIMDDERAPQDDEFEAE